MTKFMYSFTQAKPFDPDSLKELVESMLEQPRGKKRSPEQLEFWKDFNSRIFGSRPQDKEEVESEEELSESGTASLLLWEKLNGGVRIKIQLKESRHLDRDDVDVEVEEDFVSVSATVVKDGQEVRRYFMTEHMDDEIDKEKSSVKFYRDPLTDDAVVDMDLYYVVDSVPDRRLKWGN